MAAIGPISRKDLIKNFRKLGFTGPFTGGRHEFMVQGEQRVHIPNPHQGDISRDLLVRILRQANVSSERWLGL